jgi:cytochrome c peroxidase
MARAGRSWTAVATKLASVPPLARASALPPDVAAAISARPSYPQLFAAAFGDTQITARRIAFAIASYERTLVPDQTPWDAFMRGDATALTARQQEGWEAFRGSLCASCHVPPLFTDHAFHNIGVRPVVEDVGRQQVTGLFADRGKFRTPTLRNAGLKRRFMHNGGFASVAESVFFYLDNRSLQFPENLDPLMPLVQIDPDQELALIDFIQNGLVDPRVRNEAFPFDRPALSASSPP